MGGLMFERVKIINGLEYRYIVRNERIGKRVKQIVVKYLGSVQPVYKKTKKETRKSNAWLFAKKPTEAESNELKKSLSSTSAFTRDRARIILFSADGKHCEQIAEKIGCETRKVRATIKKFNDIGLKTLERGKAKGAAPKFDEITKKLMLLHFAKSPRKFGHHFTTWTLPRFRKHLVEQKIVNSISIEMVRQILIKAGGKLKKSKRWQYSPDKEFVKKNKK